MSLSRTNGIFVYSAVTLLAAAAAGAIFEGFATRAEAAAGCASVPRPKPKPDGGRRAPTRRLDPKRTYDVTFVTNCGRFTVRLDVRHSPRTAASFFELARTGFFDRTVFHRIVPGFVIQGGDPTGTGTGGPGYSTVDRPPRTTRYTRGVVGMAKTATQPPGTSGSQFFVVTARDAGLPPEYTLLGRVVSGLPVVLRIGRLGNRQTQLPTQTVEIERALVRAVA
jgi:cyclophilin family peptidyl-prolyl cis-trans isomerase